MSSEWGRIDDRRRRSTSVRRGRAPDRLVAGRHPRGGAWPSTQRYDDLAADVRLLEGRAKSDAQRPHGGPRRRQQAPRVVTTAAAIGDLGALCHPARRRRRDRRRAASAAAKKAAERAKAAEAAADAKRALVAEAEQLADEQQLEGRRRALPRDRRGVEGDPGVDRKTDSALWGVL